MRSIFTRTAVAVCSLIFFAGMILIPGKTVKADEDADISLGQTIAVDLVRDDTWWFRLVLTQDKMVEFTSEGDASLSVSVYGDTKDYHSFISPGDRADDGYNFRYKGFLPAGTYYFEVTLNGSLYDNNSKVILKDITDTSFVAAIDESNFPDEIFRNFVDTNLDLRDDGKLTRDEIMIVKELDLRGKNIQDLKGIGYFTELKELNVYNNKLKTLDLSRNTKLIDVDCYMNPDLVSLNVSGCSNLDELDCHSTEISSLNMTGCKKLRSLDCSKCNIAKLDLSPYPNLQRIVCYTNPLTSIKLDGIQYVNYLNVRNTNITSLDVSSIPYISELICSGNTGLKTIKLNKDIRQLNCSGCALTSLDLTDLENLYFLNCTGNPIKDLDLRGSVLLDGVYTYGTLESPGTYTGTVNGINCTLSFDEGVNIIGMSGKDDKVVEINGTNFPDLNFRNIIKDKDNDGDGWLNKFEISCITSLEIEQRNISSLQGVEYLTFLRSLDCSDNNISQIDLSKNTKLVTLSINYCKLSNLDLSKNTGLVELRCTSNNLKTLNISNCKALTDLMCGENSITSLDLSKNTNLENLGCENNKITSLDISGCQKLEYVLCYGNSMKTLTLGKQAKLGELACQQNELVKLDITDCPILLKLVKEEKRKENLGIVGYVRMDGKDTVAEELIFDKNTTLVTVKPTATPTPKPVVKVTLTLDKKTANITCGKTLNLKAALKGSTSKIAWMSTNNKIATVDSTGKITSKMAGQVTITATAAGKNASCTVTVLYKDVTNSKDFWYAPTNYLTAKGVVKGYDKQTKFKPANDCTRAQMVTFLYRLQGEPKVKSTTCKFKDVKKTDYFYKPVIWANENGITTGISKTKFGPQGVCTRAQTVTFLWRMAKKPTPKTTKNKFPDVKKSDYFYTATLWASEKKILAGLPDGTFNPQGKCLRRQMVTFLYKYDKFINNKGK